MNINSQLINRMSNTELIEYIDNINISNLQDTLEYISLNLNTERIPNIIDKKTFSFILQLLSNKKIIGNKGFLSWIIDFESSDLNFSKINKNDRFNLIDKIMSLSNFYENSVACEVGRFIIRCLLINKLERLEYIKLLKSKLNSQKYNSNYIDILYFMLLDYLNNTELTAIQQNDIINFLKEITSNY